MIFWDILMCCKSVPCFIWSEPLTLASFEWKHKTNCLTHHPCKIWGNNIKRKIKIEQGRQNTWMKIKLLLQFSRLHISNNCSCINTTTKKIITFLVPFWRDDWPFMFVKSSNQFPRSVLDSGLAITKTCRKQGTLTINN